MPNSSSVGIEIGVSPKSSPVETGDREPFRIAVFGDFGGGREAGPIEIDRDNFDEVMARMRPAIALMPEGSGTPIPIEFQSLDDFHPDSLFERQIFEKLRALRIQLSDPASFREATPERQAPDPEPPRFAASSGSLLDQMVEENGSGAARAPSRPGDLRDYIDRAMEGSLVPGKNPVQEALVHRTDTAVAEEMRALLHHSRFQALEAAWRGIFFLVRRLETSADLQVWLFDRSKQELAKDLTGATDLRRTRFWRDVATAGESGRPWALLIGNYSFGPEPGDVELLARIAMVASQGRAPFLAAAQPAALGCDSLTGMPDPRDWQSDPEAAAFWQTLRELPEATSLGLLLPRFLLRLPYGKDTSATERFPFEEMPGAPSHEDYLWGNPAIAAACLLGQSFTSEGWNMRPDSSRELSGLPLHTYRQDGEPVSQPSAEAWLNDRAAEAILRQGIMPLVSSRNSDSVLLVRFQSLADPAKALAGRW